jgi:hypothetical protein
MAHDIEDADEQSPPRVKIALRGHADREALEVILEIAAAFLTLAPDSVFTEAELFREARTLVDDELDETDLKAALGTMDSLERVGELLRLK